LEIYFVGADTGTMDHVVSTYYSGNGSFRSHHHLVCRERYDKEKAEIKGKAEEFAKQKIIAQDRAGNFGYALIFLQAAIMLSSVAALTKKKPLWYFGMAMVSGWAFFFLDAIFLFH
jgi:hypothetical protein